MVELFALRRDYCCINSLLGRVLGEIKDGLYLAAATSLPVAAVPAIVAATQKMIDHWIQGQPLPDHTPRWSVIRDVLHWVQ